MLGLAVLTAACASTRAAREPQPQPEPGKTRQAQGLVALLPDPGAGAVGRAVVSNPHGQVELTQARESTRVGGDAAPTAPVLVHMEGGMGRLMGEAYNADVSPVRGTPDDVSGHLAAMASAGARHVQLVVDPITEDSIARLGPALTRLDRSQAQPV